MAVESMGDELAIRDEKGSRQYVCADCFDDKSIQRFVRRHAAVVACDFCSRRGESPIAAPWSNVLNFIIEGLDSVWTRDYECSIEYDIEDSAGPRSYSARDLLEEWLGPIPPILTESVIDELARCTGALHWANIYLTNPWFWRTLEVWKPSKSLKACKKRSCISRIKRTA
jgi:hypothetical protein